MTERALAALPPLAEGADRAEWSDEQCAGLRFIQSEGGRGRWLFRYTLGGRKCAMSLGPHPAVDVKAARLKVLEAQARLAAGENPAEEVKAKKQDMTFARFVEERFLPHQRSGERGRSRGRDAEWMMNRRILATFGKMRLRDVTREDVMQFQTRVAEETSEATSNRNLACLARCLSLAHQWGYIPANPAARVKKYRELPSKEETLTEDEVRRLDAVLRDAHCPQSGGVIRLLLWTGMRKTEAASLRWEDVRLGAEGDPKAVPVAFLRRTKSGRPRVVPLNTQAAAVLRGMEAHRDESSSFVFHSPTELGYVHDLRVTWSKAKKLAGLPPEFRLHGLRHAFASRLVMGGNSLYITQKLLGHETPSMTMRYAHLADPELLAASESVAKIAKAAG